MRSRFAGGVWVAALLTVVGSGASQRVSAGAPQRAGATTVTVSAEIDGKRYDYAGPGECVYAAAGSIYDEPATMWHARFEARGNPLAHASLAVWQLKQGRAIRLNLSARVGNVSYDISTAQKGAAKGSAIGGGENGAAGGRLSAEGRTAEGKAMKISIACSRFDAPEDNGD